MKEWLRETMRKLLLRAALEAGRERKCEGDGSRAALPLSLPLVALQVQKIWGLRQQVDIVRRLWCDNRKDVWYGK